MQPCKGNKGWGSGWQGKGKCLDTMTAAAASILSPFRLTRSLRCMTLFFVAFLGGQHPCLAMAVLLLSVDMV